MTEEIENSIAILPESRHLYEDVCHIIDDTRTRVAAYVNMLCGDCLRVAETFSEAEIVYALRIQFSRTYSLLRR